MIGSMRAAPAPSGQKPCPSPRAAARVRGSIFAVVAFLILAQLVSAFTSTATWACHCPPPALVAPEPDACCRLTAPAEEAARPSETLPDCTACLTLPATDTACSQTWTTPRPAPVLVMVTPPILMDLAAWPEVIRLPDRWRRAHLPPPQTVRCLRSVILTC